MNRNLYFNQNNQQINENQLLGINNSYGNML